MSGRGFTVLRGVFGVAGLCSLGACNALVVDAFEPIDCKRVPLSERCRFDYWPNPVSSANSDPWLVAHHDALTEIRPRVLVLNFDNQSPGDAIRPTVDARIKALAEGSRYHGYRNAEAPVFVRYEVAGVVDFTDADPSASAFSSSTRVPVDAENRFESSRLFGPEFTFPDPADPARQVGLCALFETGAVNEVWLAVADGMREPPLMLERKQEYDTSLSAVAGQFNPCSVSSGDCLDLDCGVTVRLAHLNPRRGSGCDLQVRGWSILETGASIPYFAENATAFFNADFRTRFGATFASFSEICQPNTPCVAYPSSTVAAADGTGTWRFDPYSQGCGTPEFPPNAATRFDWRSATEVESRCEHYGLGDGAGGDLYEPYAASKLAVYDDLLPEDPAFPLDCGGGWQMYWRQSLPGLDNLARGADGNPMKNWWPFMFY